MMDWIEPTVDTVALGPRDANQLSKFAFVAVAVQRARQLRSGARPRIDVADHTLLRVALLEVTAGVISWNVAQAPSQDGDSPAPDAGGS